MQQIKNKRKLLLPNFYEQRYKHKKLGTWHDESTYMLAFTEKATKAKRNHQKQDNVVKHL